MGFFGNKDVKALRRELMALRVALTLGAAASTSVGRFEAGVASTQTDSVSAARRIKAAGKSADGMAVVVKAREHELRGEARDLYDRLLVEVEAALN